MLDQRVRRLIRCTHAGCLQPPCRSSLCIVRDDRSKTRQAIALEIRGVILGKCPDAPMLSYEAPLTTPLTSCSTQIVCRSGSSSCPSSTPGPGQAPLGHMGHNMLVCDPQAAGSNVCLPTNQSCLQGAPNQTLLPLRYLHTLCHTSFGNFRVGPRS